MAQCYDMTFRLTWDEPGELPASSRNDRSRTAATSCEAGRPLPTSPVAPADLARQTESADRVGVREQSADCMDCKTMVFVQLLSHDTLPLALYTASHAHSWLLFTRYSSHRSPSQRTRRKKLLALYVPQPSPISSAFEEEQPKKRQPGWSFGSRQSTNTAPPTEKEKRAVMF